MITDEPSGIDLAMVAWTAANSFRDEPVVIRRGSPAADALDRLVQRKFDEDVLLQAAEGTGNSIVVAFALCAIFHNQKEDNRSFIERYIGDERMVRVGIGSFVLNQTLGSLAAKWLVQIDENPASSSPQETPAPAKTSGGKKPEVRK